MRTSLGGVDFWIFVAAEFGLALGSTNGMPNLAARCLRFSISASSVGGDAGASADSAVTTGSVGVGAAYLCKSD